LAGATVKNTFETYLFDSSLKTGVREFQKIVRGSILQNFYMLIL